MKKNILNRIIALVLFAFATILLTGCYKPNFEYEEIDPGQLPAPSVKWGQEGFRDAYPTLEKYEEEVTITIAVTQYDLESNVKIGTTPENQSFNRLAKKYLNINLDYVVVGSSTTYDNKINLYISSGKMPDMFYTSNVSLYSQLLEDGVLADLSDVLWNLNDDLLENYITYFPTLLPTCMEEGKLYAFPAITNNYTSAQRLYIRQDWLDIVGMEAPKTIEEMIAVGEAFVSHKAEIAATTGISENRVIPFTMNKELTWAGSYSSEGFFNCFGTSINSYFPDSDNKLGYSNVSDNTKDALSTLSNMYKSGVLDKEFLSKSAEQIQANIKAGYVGMVFGEWWMAKDVLDDCINNIDGSNWTWVNLPTASSEEALPIVDSVAVSGYNIVSKNCKHKDALAKLINLFYDIYYNDNAQEIYGDDVLPSNGFYYQFVPVKLWDGIASVREYYRVQEVFDNLYNNGFDPKDYVEEEYYKEHGMYEIVKSKENNDYVVSTTGTSYNVINRNCIEAINNNEIWKNEFNKLRNREKILHFVDGYPYFVAYKEGKNVKEMNKGEKVGWGIYHEMIDPNGGYAYVVNLTEGKEHAKYDAFYGPNLSAMVEYIEYINTQTNVIFTKIITGQMDIKNFEKDYAKAIFYNNGGNSIIDQVNAWYKAHNVDYDNIYALVK